MSGSARPGSGIRDSGLGIRSGSAFPASSPESRAPSPEPRTPSPVTSSTRSTTLPPRIWNTCTTAPAGPEFQAECVPVAELGARHLLLPRAQRLDRPDGVTNLRRLLVALLERRVGHALAQRAHELVVAPFEKELRVLDGHLVFVFRADFPDARRGAPLDVELEAGARALAGDRLVARPDPEQLVRQRHRPAGERGRHERACVVMRVALDAAGHQDPRKRLAGGQLQVRIRLVVAEQDVVLGRPLLDQVVFERERLDHRVGDDDLQAVRFVEQRVDARAGPVGPQVAADAVPQHPGLSDVQSLPLPVVIQVNAGLFRQPGHLGLEITDRHAVHCAFWRNPEPFIIPRP